MVKHVFLGTKSDFYDIPQEFWDPEKVHFDNTWTFAVQQYWGTFLLRTAYKLLQFLGDDF